MEARLKSSKKWSAIPKELVKQVQVALGKNFPVHAKSGQFQVEGRIYPTELLVRVGYLENGRLKQDNFEISIEYKAGKEDMVKLIYLAVDAGASLLDQLLNNSDERPEFPAIWTEFEAEGRMLFVQHSAVNSKLESEADRLLGLKEGALLEDREDDEQPEKLKRLLGLDPDDDEDPDEGQIH
jgi:hypothetical protein